MHEIGTILGVKFEQGAISSDGFVLRLTHDETAETLLINRFVSCTLWEAVIRACQEVWAEEIAEHKDENLPIRIATTLGIPERYEEEK